MAQAQKDSIVGAQGKDNGWVGGGIFHFVPFAVSLWHERES